MDYVELGACGNSQGQNVQRVTSIVRWASWQRKWDVPQICNSGGPAEDTQTYGSPCASMSVYFRKKRVQTGLIVKIICKRCWRKFQKRLYKTFSSDLFKASLIEPIFSVWCSTAYWHWEVLLQCNVRIYVLFSSFNGFFESKGNLVILHVSIED